jgi:hypothetical protein
MTPHLLSGESVVTTERQHVAVLVPATLLAVICLGVPLILIQLVPDQVSGKNVSGAKAIADAVVAVVVVAWYLLRVLRWRFHTYTLTTHRIVLSSGVISRVTESIQSAGRDGTEVLRLVPKPDRFYTQILQAIEDYRVMAYPGAAEQEGRAAPSAPQGSAGGV